MEQLQVINNQINALEASLVSLRAQRQSIIDTQAELQKVTTAYDNALSAIFDGIKYRADEDNPFPFVAPMKCYPNMFYSVTENDGIKDIVKKFVCVATTPTIVDDSNFAEVMEVW